MMEVSSLRLGDGPFFPEFVFDSLPLTSDSWRMLPGPLNGNRRVFEYCVRQYMVLYLKGVNPTEANIRWPFIATDIYKSEVLEEAKNFISQGLSPYYKGAQSRIFLKT